MANIASLLVNIGVKLDGALAVESKIKSLRGTTEAMARTGATATTRFGRAFQAMGATVRSAAVRAKTAIGGLVDKMGGLRTMALAGGAALGGAAMGIFHMVDSQTAAMDATVKLSRALGIGVEEYQRLAYAANLSGVEEANLGVAMREFNKNLLDMSTGGGKAATEALASIGLSFEDLDGMSRTSQIGVIGDKLNGIADAATRSATAAKIFGMRAGPQMASLLAEGLDGLTRLGQEAHGVFSEQDANRAEAFQDQLTAVKDQVSALFRGLATKLLPVLADMLKRFQDWLSVNEGIIQQKIPELFDSMASAAKTIGDAIDLVVDALGIFGVKMSGAEVAVTAFGIAAVASINPIAGALLAAAAAANVLANALANALDMGEVDWDKLMGMSPADRAREIRRQSQQAEARKAQRAAEAKRDAEIWAQGAGIMPGGLPWAPELERPEAERPGKERAPQRARAAGGGGARGGTGKTGAVGRWLASGMGALQGAGGNLISRLTTGLPSTGPVTVDDAIAALLSGRGGGSTMIQQLANLAERSPSVAEAHPQVAMDLTINQNFTNQQTITAPTPIEAANLSAAAIRDVLRQETTKAGQAIAGNVVR